MSRHNFDMLVVIGDGLGRTSEKRRTWKRFESLANDFGYNIQPTKGYFLTHQIDCDKETFEILLDLV